MKPQDFFNNNNGKYLDYDGYFGPQCMDLYHYYVRDVLPGYPNISAPNAAQLIGKLPSSHYTWIANTPLAIPQLGDILLWSTNHVAIFVSGNLFLFTSFDQNYPANSPSHFQNHNYFGGLKGWYRPKQLQLTDDQKEQKIKEILNSPGTSSDHLQSIEKIIHG